MTDKDTEDDKIRAKEATAALIRERRQENERRDGQIEGSEKDAVDSVAETLSDQKEDEQS